MKYGTKRIVRSLLMFSALVLVSCAERAEENWSSCERTYHNGLLAETFESEVAGLAGPVLRIRHYSPFYARQASIYKEPELAFAYLSDDMFEFVHISQEDFHYVVGEVERIAPLIEGRTSGVTEAGCLIFDFEPLGEQIYTSWSHPLDDDVYDFWENIEDVVSRSVDERRGVSGDNTLD